MQATVFAGLHLVADIDLAGRVFADQNDGQAGRDAACFQRSGSQCDICSQFLGELIAVYSLGCHGLLGFNVCEMVSSSKYAREYEFHGRYNEPAKG
jgi:hypothetical protein